ncbi:DNA-directed RNA polymerase subunit omega [Natronospira bacteriovora]|uniref:DNA-directed RNA polymerase subunit omega n=1 Tax=Natronospira bacteriovora TaxID=3069753 RepID=A0ABU0W867_9GAMM|nr:DNA-directed RNA polymerase subunit omega [Natronospira sp. AB-CW4]MDQ2070191.1 DNA-directed RNA polymerase subunit omega [Natronospira sp. AB-CW4]
MARVTIEDCIEKCHNQFELVLLATKRARQLERGAEAMVPLENDKPTVLALREIADGLVNREMLEEQEAREASEAMAAEAAAAAEQASEAGEQRGDVDASH